MLVGVGRFGRGRESRSISSLDRGTRITREGGGAPAQSAFQTPRAAANVDISRAIGGEKPADIARRMALTPADDAHRVELERGAHDLVEHLVGSGILRVETPDHVEVGTSVAGWGSVGPINGRALGSYHPATAALIRLAMRDPATAARRSGPDVFATALHEPFHHPWANPAEYVDESVAFPLPESIKEFSLTWGIKGAKYAVEIFIRQKRVAIVTDGSRPGWSAFAKKEGPLAKPLRDYRDEDW